MVNFARVVSDLDTRLNASLLRRKRDKGTLRPVVAVPYRGWVSNGNAHVRARVMETKGILSGSDPLGSADALRSNLRRFNTLEVPDARVVITIAGSSTEALSDMDGYVVADVPVADLAPGWHQVEIDLPDEQTVETAAENIRGRVLVPDPAATVMVVSDIDDTILKTGITEGVKALSRMLLNDAHTRFAVPGMASFYRALARGAGEGHESAIFYVSAGPWNLYDMLTQFMQIKGFPRGPLFLTDWGPEGDRIMRDAREHKIRVIRQLMQEFPHMGFVLVGDSGERDPEVYAQLAKEHRDQVRAVFIVEPFGTSLTRGQQVQSRADRMNLVGIPFYYVRDALTAVTQSVALDLVTADSIDEVMVELSGGF